MHARSLPECHSHRFICNKVRKKVNANFVHRTGRRSIYFSLHFFLPFLQNENFELCEIESKTRFDRWLIFRWARRILPVAQPRTYARTQFKCGRNEKMVTSLAARCADDGSQHMLTHQTIIKDEENEFHCRLLLLLSSDNVCVYCVHQTWALKSIFDVSFGCRGRFVVLLMGLWMGEWVLMHHRKLRMASRRQRSGPNEEWKRIGYRNRHTHWLSERVGEPKGSEKYLTMF